MVNFDSPRQTPHGGVFKFKYKCFAFEKVTRLNIVQNVYPKPFARGMNKEVYSMRKSDKKIENKIRGVLTEVCENTLKSYEGFLWVTHTVNFSSFPQSLKIVCVFKTNQDRANFLAGEAQKHVSKTIQQAFNQVGVQLKNVDKQISYHTQ